MLHVTRALLAMGCYEVSLGDTLGVGSPHDIETLLAVLLAPSPPPPSSSFSSASSSSAPPTIAPSQLAGHFHDTYGQALANVLVAHRLGLRTFDSSVAGLGGCPYAPGARGNLATEDLVYALGRHGVATGVDLRALAATGQWISDVLGVPNGSRAGAALAATMTTTTTTKMRTRERQGEEREEQQQQAVVLAEKMPCSSNATTMTTTTTETDPITPPPSPPPQ